jgi:hypothetical protein
MIERRSLLRALPLAAFGALAPRSPAMAQAVAPPDDTARFLAGMPLPPGSPLARWTAEPGWRSHAAELDRSWAALRSRRLRQIRAWSDDYLGVRRPVLFYMFSGPDFLYADAFFPDAEVYVLSGLEPVGPIPEITSANRGSLGRIRNAISSSLNLSFFKTIDMRSDFAGGALSGTLPALYVFLARAGKTVTEAVHVRLSPAGEILELPPGTPGPAMGVRIRFSEAGRPAQTLYYFQVDVSNSGPSVSAFLEFCTSQGTGDAFVKSASYLMHSDHFSRVRGFLLERAQTIVQDDSGIPARFFAPADWQLVPFGRYLGPIPLFSNHYQQRLAELHRRAEPLPLGFGIGYRHTESESNLLLAIARPR